jgi:hypothetical protein
MTVYRALKALKKELVGPTQPAAAGRLSTDAPSLDPLQTVQFGKIIPNTGR